ncbi:hypothetical protein [Carboxylicivirga sp. M1479]|uniref:hypothetical protein n=1 Tax=Carboxylicivirga sp. M1479 TaxID=2594476 RepID=UPI0011774534|nr:hypothetical protein [Carboxylicivirga sp. M1479]TRX66101.1 hypothetical protein FNN09_14965 [Carboxylicivirga sp. M1479]
MLSKKFRIFFNVACWIGFVITIVMMIKGADLLLKPVLGLETFPLGTMVAWLGFVFLAMACYPLKQHKYTWLTNLSKMAIINAFAWGVLSYLLAGNWNFTFDGSAIGFRGSDEAFTWFVRYSSFTLSFPVVVSVISFITNMILRTRTNL